MSAPILSCASHIPQFRENFGGHIPSALYLSIPSPGKRNLEITIWLETAMSRQQDIADKVRSMSTQELLDLVISNPHFLSDPYYRDVRAAIVARQEELRRRRHPIHEMIAKERAKQTKKKR